MVEISLFYRGGQRQVKTQAFSKLISFSSKTETGKCCKISWVLIEWYLPLVIYGHFPPSYRSQLKKVNCINILGNNGSRKCLIFITTKPDVMLLASLADVGMWSVSSPALTEWTGCRLVLWACFVILKHKKEVDGTSQETAVHCSSVMQFLEDLGVYED